MFANVSKYTIASILLIVIGGTVAFLLQHLLGNFPVDIFRFPLNYILLAVWLYAVVEIYRKRDSNLLARYLLSTEATCLSIIVLVAVSVVMGLQREPATCSYPVVVALLYVLTQLTMVILRGWRNSKGVRWRFVFNHVGLWLAVGAGFWGAPDTKVVRLMIDAEQTYNMAYCADGSVHMLDYTLQLVDFRTDYYENGVPSWYEADVAINRESVTLAVNHPHAVNFIEDIYLTALEYDEDGVYCIIQVVKQPAKLVMAIGIIMLIVGAIMMFVQGYKQRIQ